MKSKLKKVYVVICEKLTSKLALIYFSLSWLLSGLFMDLGLSNAFNLVSTIALGMLFIYLFIGFVDIIYLIIIFFKKRKLEKLKPF